MPALPPRALATVLATAVVMGVGCGEPDPVAVDGTPLRLTLSEYRIAPQAVVVAAGPLRLVVRNGGTMVHRMQVRTGDRSDALVTSPPLRPGETARLVVTLRPGRYVLTDPLERHHTLGERGTIEAR